MVAFSVLAPTVVLVCVSDKSVFILGKINWFSAMDILVTIVTTLNKSIIYNKKINYLKVCLYGLTNSNSY